MIFLDYIPNMSYFLCSSSCIRFRPYSIIHVKTQGGVFFDDIQQVKEGVMRAS